MPKYKIVLLSVFALLLVVGLWVNFNSATLKSVDGAVAHKNEAASEPAVNSPTTANNTNANPSGKPLPKSTTTQAQTKVLTGNPHYDQLSPEMQKALKDSLLLEGPKKTYTRPDGSVVLPSNGRFTQMPVAVQMPDGTIKIQEYSNIPKPQLKLNVPK